MLARSLFLVAVAATTLAPTVARADDDPDWTAKLVARADDIADKVAKMRGLAKKRPIDKGVMDDTQLRARILARMDEDSSPAERALDAATAKRWGLVPMATDVDALVVDLLTEQIAGFYDPAEAKLYVSAKPGTDDTWADMLMSHEITHALQDQHFGLDKWMSAVKANSDASTARQALVEGDGVALMIEYTLAKQGMGAPWDHDEVVRLMTAGMDGAGGGAQLERAPIALREAMLFPYRAGVGFVAALRKGQPWSAVDAAYARPPRSTEQILHPSLYLADAKPDVVTPGKDPKTLDTAIWGEEGWREFLVAHGVDAAIAGSAAAGWGGDVVVLRGGPDAVAHPAHGQGLAVTTWDTDADVLEFWDAIGRAADDLASAPLIVDGPDRMVWMSWSGRVTAIERRDRRIAIVTGATVGQWRRALDLAWSWPITWAKRP